MDKTAKYELLTEQIRALIAGETDLVAVMANVSAAIHETMGFWWTGFYRVMNGEDRRTIIVPDVEQFPGHIACSSLSRSEIVVPVFSTAGDVVAVLDIDSKELATFDTIDQQYLEQICKLLTPIVTV